MVVKSGGERFPDLVITVNKGHPDECIYIIELKYLKKAEAGDKNSERTLKSVIKAASAELTAYISAIDFKAKKNKSLCHGLCRNRLYLLSAVLVFIAQTVSSQVLVIYAEDHQLGKECGDTANTYLSLKPRFLCMI